LEIIAPSRFGPFSSFFENLKRTLSLIYKKIIKAITDTVPNQTTTMLPLVVKGLSFWVGKLEYVTRVFFESNKHTKNGKPAKHCHSKSDSIRKYERLLSKFVELQVDVGVMVHCSILFRKVMERRNSNS